MLGSNGYDGSAADIWSCGVILYVLMAGYFPFEENDLPRLYEKVPASFNFAFLRILLSPKIVDSNNYLAHVTLKALLLFLHFKITAAQYSCPYWFSPGATSLIRRIIDPNPRTVSKCTSLFRSSIWIWNNAYHVTFSFQKILITSCSVNYLQASVHTEKLF